LFTVITQVPDHFRDPLRERLRALEAAARPIGVLFFAETDPFRNAVWARFFGRERPAEVINLVALAVVPEESRAAVVAEWLGKIDTALRRDAKVWLDASSGTLDAGAIANFVAALRSRYRLSPDEESSVPGLLAVLPKIG
jgi:hypothetical protein